MRRLLPAFEGMDVAFVSVSSDYASEVRGRRFYAVRDAHRFDKMSFMILFAQLAWIVIRERPRIVISTGSAPGLICLALAKLLVRADTVWIDSIANCEQLSSSGRQARRVADVWLTQWPQLQSEQGPHYWGAVL
jgi:hypothetical protein